MRAAYPPSVTHLLGQIVKQHRQVLGHNLLGIYLHGSLAMGTFNPSMSDIDFLVITHHKVPPFQRKQLAETLITLSEKAPPKGLEMSVITESSLRDFRYPTPFEFHFGKSWLERMKQNEVDFTQEDRVDADLAAHLTVTKARGRVLYGPPIDEIFPDIPSQYYQASILEDVGSILQDMAAEPVYNVLNLCRVRAFVDTGAITSKREGGEWARDHATPFQQDVIDQALAEYAGKQKEPWDVQALQRFGQEMARLLPL
jgi:streptomycin 3"-adenylyltransferase